MKEAIRTGVKLLTLLMIACRVGAMPARAASFPCAKASTPVERAICGDPVLSDADSTLARLYAQVLANTRSPEDVRNEQRRWLTTTRNATIDVTALRGLYEARIAGLRGELEPGTSPSANRSCVPAATNWNNNGRETCQVVQSGPIPNAPGPALAYQIQSYANENVLKALVVYRSGWPGPRAVLRVLESGVSYDPPKVVGSRAGTLLYLLGSTGGSGAFPDNALYIWRDPSWTEVDIDSWIKDLSRRLPNGLGAWKGLYPDWSKMTANTPLWRPTDANCCPTGGAAVMWLRLDGDRIVLDRLELTKPGGR